MNADQLLGKIGQGKGKKQKGLPKRVRNPVKKNRAARSRARLPEKKVRHVLKRNGLVAAKEYVAEDRCQMSTLRKVCQEKGISI